MGFFSKFFQKITLLFKKRKQSPPNVSSQTSEVLILPKEAQKKKKEELQTQNLEVVREAHKPIRFINDNIIVRRIEGTNFIFDKESFKEFESFVDDNHILIVENGYLARRHKRKDGFITFFHIWLMSNEVDKFKETHGCNVEVDHLNGKNDNRKIVLRVTSERDHKRRHGREKEYWDKIEKKRKELLQQK